MTRPLRIGFALNFRTTSREPASIQRTYEQVIDTIAYAEQLGIDSVWIGQHHFDNTDGPIPSPLVFLAAAVQRTHRITLGTGITTLPFEDPIRLAEDAAVLDVLTGGRVLRSGRFGSAAQGRGLPRPGAGLRAYRRPAGGSLPLRLLR